ncbi:urease accessory protein UreF [Actinobaculum suis]|uniref:urease accessory protein UreF n=1 Tax=Actinobaculum suis TaxID=1657 RepID=UPI00080875AA|nr:urease accessory UreF family protein [Actinobaculum suis]OCA93680.1 urease accessory protein UreF [Actinobaculum suis]OCA94207.1 urease accessory protein UreF [Actinobaculum suis]
MPNTHTNTRADLVMWHLTDSALPTGGFAHSAGLETYIQTGKVGNAESFTDWLHGYVRQASFNDALAVKLAWELYHRDIPDESEAWKEELRELDALYRAAQTASQVRTSMSSMGKRMSIIASLISPDDPRITEYSEGIKSRRYHANPGIVTGLVLASVGTGKAEAVTAYLMQIMHSMVQNAIRAIPLGQDAGQRVIVNTYDVILQAADMTLAHDEADIGVVAPRLEIAQMEHETLRSRMFMS